MLGLATDRFAAGDDEKKPAKGGAGWRRAAFPKPILLRQIDEPYAVSVSVNAHYVSSTDVELGPITVPPIIDTRGLKLGPINDVLGTFGVPGVFPEGQFRSMYFVDVEFAEDRCQEVPFRFLDKQTPAAVNDDKAYEPGTVFTVRNPGFMRAVHFN